METVVGNYFLDEDEAQRRRRFNRLIAKLFCRLEGGGSANYVFCEKDVSPAAAANGG